VECVLPSDNTAAKADRRKIRCTLNIFVSDERLELRITKAVSDGDIVVSIDGSSNLGGR
jgi:hypothetical protein